MAQPCLIELPAPDDTDRLGRDFALALLAASSGIARRGLALRLEGNLGAGKTSFVRATLRALGWQGAVKSPTFTLLETYPLEGFTLNHFDFYRFETPEEFDDAGFGEEFGPGRVCCTEWSGRAEPFLPPADLTLALAHAGAGRRAALSAASPLGEEILRTMTERSASWKQAAAV